MNQLQSQTWMLLGVQPTAQNQLPEDAAVGSYADKLPTLAAQEHVDALQPGHPFK
jgi:hypothetical protein